MYNVCKSAQYKMKKISNRKEYKKIRFYEEKR